MTPEEYERFKEAEKEHLQKLKELKKAVRVLERQKKIQSALDDVSRSSENALEAQNDIVEQLALETARREARLEIALESASEQTDETVREKLEDELRRERARALVDELKASIQTGSDRTDERAPSRQQAPAEPPDTTRPRNPGTVAANPTKDRKERPDKTIGRM